jgi:heterodisulfide reductase subunit B
MSLRPRFRKAGVHAAYPQPPGNHSTYRVEIAKEQGANKLLTNCPPCLLSLEQGLEFMREAGGPMECGIFDFYKVFSRAFGEE